MHLEAGLLIGNRFRLLGRIRVGTLGALWRAADRVPGKEVAVRFVGEPTANAGDLSAFEAETRIATQMRHRSAVRIYELGRDPKLGVWVATELVDGDPLDVILERRGPLPAADALTVIAELAGAVSELHSLGVAHGAISARAVIVPRSKTEAPRPKLLGVGRAQIVGGSQRGARAGYLSPETMTSQQCVAASDVWSLGVLLFKCMTGRLPFTARAPVSFQTEVRSMSRILEMIDDANVRSLLEDCFAMAPEARLGAAALAERAERTARALRQELPRDTHSATPVVEPPPQPPADTTPKPAAEASPAVDTPPVAPVIAAPAEPPPEPAPQPVIDPDPDIDPEPLVEFRPRRPRAKFVVGAIAAAAIVFELIVATSRPREMRAAPTENAHVESAIIPEPTSAPSATEVPAVASPTPAPTVIAAAPPATAATATAAAVVAAQKPAATTTPQPTKPATDDNPYE